MMKFKVVQNEKLKVPGYVRAQAKELLDQQNVVFVIFRLFPQNIILCSRIVVIKNHYLNDAWSLPLIIVLWCFFEMYQGIFASSSKQFLIGDYIKGISGNLQLREHYIFTVEGRTLIFYLKGDIYESFYNLCKKKPYKAVKILSSKSSCSNRYQ